MRFLVDECLPVHAAVALQEAGHDALHCDDLGLLGAPDEDVMAVARAEGRVLLSADSDFGELLAVGKHAVPSLVLFRGPAAPHRRVRLLLDNLDQIVDELAAGAIVVISVERIRIRLLPVD